MGLRAGHNEEQVGSAEMRKPVGELQADEEEREVWRWRTKAWVGESRRLRRAMLSVDVGA